MRALLCEALASDLSGVRVADVPAPAIAAGALRVELHAAALNFPDLLMTQGGYQFKPEMPFVPGIEGCGVCTEVGAGVDAALLGARLIVGARSSCMAAEIVVPADQVRAAPAALTDDQAASLTVTGLTAWVGLVVRGRLAAGERVLVLGAGSGVSLAAIDVAHALGATVVAAASSGAKLEGARAKGVSASIVTPRTGTTAQMLKDALGGPVDVVFDPVGAALAEPALRCLGWRGRYLVIGFAGGAIPAVALNLALLKGIEIVGVRAGEYGRRDPVAHARHLAAIDALAGNGWLVPPVTCTTGLDQALDLFRAMQAGTLVGKAVVRLRD